MSASYYSYSDEKGNVLGVEYNNVGLEGEFRYPEGKGPEDFEGVSHKYWDKEAFEEAGFSPVWVKEIRYYEEE
jgi:hypothetical protein